MTEPPEKSHIYMRVLSHIERLLKEGTGGNSSFAFKIDLCTIISQTEPSLKVTPFDSTTTIIYDIEVDVDSFTLSKWTEHSSRCSLLIVVVPRKTFEKTQNMCATTLTNYEIWGYSLDYTGQKKGDFSIELHR